MAALASAGAGFLSALRGASVGGNRPPPSIGGLSAGAGPYALSLLIASQPAWVIVPTGVIADRWVRSLRYHLPSRRILLYPADDGRPWDGAPRDPECARQRILARVATDAIVIAPAAAMLLKVATIEQQALRRGLVLPPQTLFRWLLAHGYLATQRVDAPGTAALRGGGMEVWGVGSETITRIAWFDDEIETIRGPPTLLPAREAPLNDASAERAVASMHAVAAERGVVGTERRRVMSDLRECVWFSGAEDWLSAIVDLGPLRVHHNGKTDGSPATGATVYVVEPDRVREEAEHALQDVTRRFDALDAEDAPLVRVLDRWATTEEIDWSGGVLTTLGNDVATRANTTLRVGTGDLAPVASQIRALARDRVAITLVADDAMRAERIRGIFEPHGITFGDGKAVLADGTPAFGALHLDIGDLPEGFTAEDVAFVTADELFGERLSERPRTSGTSFRKAASQGLAALQRGDLVVHARHGIGQFRGLSRMPLGEVEGDFVTVEYRDGDKLYVPIARLDLLAPYTANGVGEKPKLDKLGGATWEVRKAKVRDAVLKLAAEILRMHARRKVETARRYDGRDGMLAQFEETFPHVETPDQQAAIEAILEDLASGEPMDRLVVGDVGFGKTEVAMRAAFRVAEEGDQVLVLTPTTVLAFQHHATFQRRFAGFPLRIEHLSRFRSPQETAEVLRDVEAGKVDILIGTTKVLGRGVKLRRLGLVIVDEEHRFGAKQKEELKRLTTAVHYLALSATPIPRSLHMALAGIRAMSIVATPPEGRLPITTEVVRFNADRVREDILSELRRDGQVFFVHNRVASIDGVANWVRRLVPEARIVVAHGQQSDDKMEKALTTFAGREADVLVSTAIIESGIDMPTVNTMIINRAEQFGLAQLYQLRGRIGRGDVRGHCTLLVSATGVGRAEAMHRLRSLQEHTKLGSGFALASEDLEQRGGGDILGEKQHGHIAAIGFDAYVELLDEACHIARGEAARKQIEPELDVPVAALIPEDYLPDVSDRLDVYSRLANAGDVESVRRITGDLERRNGDLPAEVHNLRQLTELKHTCRALGISRVSVLKVRAILELHPLSKVPLTALARLAADAPGRFKRAGERTLEVRFTADEGQFPFRVIEWAVARLTG